MTGRRAGVRSAVAALLGALAVLALGPAGPAGAAGRPGGAPAADVGAPVHAGAPEAGARRVLLLSLPALTWAELGAVPTPNLTGLLRRSAVANFIARSVRRNTDAGDGYLTVGAGTRAEAPAVGAGLSFDAGETVGGERAGDVFERRTGRRAGTGVVDLSIGAARRRNAALLYDARLGALGAALGSHGVARAVFANADHGPAPAAGSPLTGDGPFHREAATAMIDGAGRVPAGTVSGALLEADPAAPFGVRLDPGAVERAFRSFWDAEPGTARVALVEASDLARADAYRALVSPSRGELLYRRALVQTDELVGRLLADVDPAHDAVLVMTPVNAAAFPQLGVGALAAPGVAPRYLRSSTTRRAGFVQITDVAPTVLHLFGIAPPAEMEGRRFVEVAGPVTYAARAHELVRMNERALFRDGHIGAAVATLTIWLVALVVFGLVVLVYRERWYVRLVRWLALALVGFVVGTFLVALLPFEGWSDPAYWAFVAAVAAAYATACDLIGARRAILAAVAALGGIVALQLADLATGAHLELNTVFGYSPILGIRIAGIGNLGYAQLAGGALLLAGLLAALVPASRKVWVAGTLLAVVLVFVAAPFIGQNFGGTLAAAPAFAAMLLLLAGVRMRLRHWVGLAVVLVACGLAVGFVDLLRPRSSQTHVGRFFSQVGNEGWSGFTMVIHRKLDEDLATFSQLGWTFIVLAVLVLVAVWSTRRIGGSGGGREDGAGAGSTPMAVLIARIPELRPTFVGFAILAGLGLALKDSGIAVPAMMSVLLVMTLLVLWSRAEVPRGSGGP